MVGLWGSSRVFWWLLSLDLVGFFAVGLCRGRLLYGVLMQCLDVCFYFEGWCSVFVGIGYIGCCVG